MTAAWIVAAAEAVVLLAVVVAWRRSARSVADLTEQVDDLERRRIMRRPRGLTAESAVKAVWETATLVRDKGVGGALRSSIADLAGWAEVERPALQSLAGDDGCVAILFSDIADSTATNERIGDRSWLRLLAAHDTLVTRAVARHDGRVIKNQGDGYLIAFAEAEQAVRCAIDVQVALRRSKRSGVRVRIGIHHGSVVHRDNDIFGRNVALAARVANLAQPTQVLVSGAVVQQLAEVPDLHERIDEVGEIELKGITGAQLVAEVIWRTRARSQTPPVDADN